MEEGLFPEDHRREHSSETPHVETIVVFLEINQELWALEVAGGHADVVLGARVVEFGQAPVD